MQVILLGAVLMLIQVKAVAYIRLKNDLAGPQSSGKCINCRNLSSPLKRFTIFEFMVLAVQ